MSALQWRPREGGFAANEEETGEAPGIAPFEIYRDYGDYVLRRGQTYRGGFRSAAEAKRCAQEIVDREAGEQ